LIKEFNRIDQLDATIKGLLQTIQSTFSIKGISLEHIDETSIMNALDTTYRYDMFVFSIRYWEVKFLIEANKMDEEILDKTYFLPERRRMINMIEPCLVMTSFMLPSFFKSKDSYYTNSADLLIIDEAGQMATNNAGALFAFAKSAVVAGDVYQLETIIDGSKAIDDGNIVKYAGVAPDSMLAHSYHNGNAMAMASHASPYTSFSDERGMFLLEHRRCVKAIIDYCNQLIYKDRLHPLRDEVKQPPLLSGSKSGLSLPPMGDCKLDCVSAYIPLGDKPDETIRNRSLRPQSGERH